MKVKYQLPRVQYLCNRMNNDDPEVWLGAKIQRLVFLLVFFCSNNAYAMTPSLMRAKELKSAGEGQYWEVRVTCSDLETKRFIVQTELDGPWCARDVRELCEKEKIGAAILVCAPEYRKTLEEIKLNKKSAFIEAQKQMTTKEQKRASLLQERLKLQERKLILIERKLDIGRRELELREREIRLLEKKAALLN